MVSEKTERRELGQKVGLDSKTWISIMGVLITLAVIAGGLANFIFENKAAAQESLGEVMEAIETKISRHGQRPHKGSASTREVDRLESTQRAIMQRLEVIGDRISKRAGREVRAVRAMDMPEGIDD